MKKPDLPKVVTDESILALCGEYMFDNWGICYVDYSEYDFSNCSLEAMTKLCFSSSTKWPTLDKLPKGFNPQEILKQFTTTNEGVKNLHNHGINGEGIAIAVIDNRFQGENHIEFVNANLIKYTLSNAEIGDYHFHMEDVLAKLCGKNLGIAPKSKILYYEVSDEEDCSLDVLNALKNIKTRILNGEKIRIINYSYSLTDDDNPFIYQQECIKLVEELKQLNCELVDSTRFGEQFFCCGTNFLNAKDEIDDYNPASFAKGKPYENKVKDKINILCSGRTIPEFCTINGYKYESIDCFSWTIPQVVGYYALCLQVNPNLTFKEFTELCQKSCDISSSGLNVLNAERLIKCAKEQISTEECVKNL
ncbi:MAG: hypothetical protein J6J24_04775 [Clostridia bacterium]|nr:hypothetical protein [Clostridia bacterium]